MRVTLRVAAVQAEARTGAIDHNIAKAADFVRRAALDQVDLIVFPEAFVTGSSVARMTSLAALPYSTRLVNVSRTFPPLKGWRWRASPPLLFLERAQSNACGLTVARASASTNAIRDYAPQAEPEQEGRPGRVRP